MTRRFALLGIALLALASCAKPPPVVQAPPGRIVIGAFTADPSVVVLDDSVRRTHTGTETDDDMAAAQDTLVTTLLYRLQENGIVAQRLVPGEAPGANDIVLDGRFDRISEGSRTERANGGGRPVVAGTLDVTGPGADGQRVTLASFTADSSAANVPGIRGGAAASAAALGTGGERARQLLIAGVQAEARRLANIFADQVRTFLTEKKLVPTAS
ncbi:MAG TPA: DUF4410 domain-containing protein [Acetobacteraceae bacterium]|jgi:hypothetical protein|nr:DUF4410 domain-containing protein [Acetobacteraceae bacterium]